MPCRDYMDETDNRNYQIAAVEQKNEILQKRLDNVTRLLCGVMHELEKEGVTSILSAQHEVAGLKEWWTEHKRLDALREEQERKAAEKRRLRQEREQRAQAAKQAALAKLTKEEMRALGLR